MSQTAPENRGSAVAIRTVVALVVVALGVWALFHVNPADAYLWVKSLHVIAVIAWMAGMLYLPRLLSITPPRNPVPKHRKPSR